MADLQQQTCPRLHVTIQYRYLHLTGVPIQAFLGPQYILYMGSWSIGEGDGSRPFRVWASLGFGVELAAGCSAEIGD